MKYLGKLLLFAATTLIMFAACNKSVDKNATTGETDSLRYERLRIEEMEKQAKLEATMDKVYLSSDTIPFGDLSILIDWAEARKPKSDELGRRLARLKGEAERKTASIMVTFVNNGTQTVELPYAYFAKNRGGVKDQRSTNTIAVSPSRRNDSDFHTASRLMMDPKSEDIITDMSLKPGKKKQVLYISILNKTPQLLLRFTNEQQVLDTNTSEGKQLQRMLDGSGMEATIITDEYDGTSAYVDMNSIFNK